MDSSSPVLVASPFRLTGLTSSSPIILGAGGLIAVYLVHLLLRAVFSRRNLPPGPPGLPLLGNVFDIKGKAWLQYTEWAHKYGPIFSLNMAGTTLVVVSSHKVAGDLFDRRSTIYSDRPKSVMAGEILTGGVFLVFTIYGELWRRLRRASHEEFSFTACKKYQPVQSKEAYALVADLIEEPSNWRELLMA